MTERGHREIDHTADLGFEVWASTLEDLFAESVLGLAELCYERSSVRAEECRELEVEGASIEELLVRWLHECYLLVEMSGWLSFEATRLEIDSGRLRGVVRGEEIDRDRHTLHTEIKAITYHDLAIVRDADDLWRTTVIVDV